MVSKLASSGKSASILLHIELVYSRQDSVPLLLGVQGSAALIWGADTMTSMHITDSSGADCTRFILEVCREDVRQEGIKEKR